MTFIVARKETPRGLLLVVTDADILGKAFAEGKVCLDLANDFYQGRETEKEEVKQLIPQARYLHLTGEKAVRLGLQLGFVDEKNILRVQKVPHAEVVME